MSIGNLKDSGNKGNNFPYQLAVLKLLDAIANGISAIPGIDYETRTTSYQATAAGPGYSIGDFIVRYDIIDVATSTIISTIWFNQTTQATIAAPAPANIIPAPGPTSVMVNNGAGGAAVNIQDGGNSITVDNSFLDVALSTRNAEATQLLIQALLTTIDGDTSNLDVLLSSRASEATLASVLAALTGMATEATLLTRLSKADFEARINTLGQKLMAASTPVVLASDQSSIPVTLPAGVSRVPSVQLVPANTVLSNTVAGKKQVSMRVAGANGQIGGVAIPNGITLTYTATSENDTVGSISYQTGANTTILISYLT